jgi:hypothetical protein
MRLLRAVRAISPWLAAVNLAVAEDAFRHGQPVPDERAAAAYVPDLAGPARRDTGGLREVVERYREDRQALLRFHSVSGSDLQLRRLLEFEEAWAKGLDSMSYEPLGLEERLDWHLLRAEVRHEAGLLARARLRNTEMSALLPFAEDLAGFQESRRRLRRPDPAAAAATLSRIAAAADAARKSLSGDAAKPGRIVALRAIRRLGDLGRELDDWFRFHDGYDPLFGWWVREPKKRVDEALRAHTRFLRETVVGQKEGADEPIVGDPIGAEGLRLDLEHERIPYTPEQLIAIAEKEFAWCEAEWRKAARDMGLGDDWKAALEKVKQDHVAPGEQPALIADMAYEAVEFLVKRDLVTVPPHAIDTWRMSMMSPERQKVNPFFLGGEVIQVSFPTDAMDHAGKLDSLRANNRHFCRATVHHELIPGHHLQGWYADRHHPHRQMFGTPFWMEGWALWWEMHLWDLGFPLTPENRAGMLFWRTHRCARIIFSLNFHLGKWIPEQCIDFLVDRVGHDRHTATGEVRRSFNGDYSPLYQVGYMMGAIQLRALHQELVSSGRMTEKRFHDSILEGGMMPIELVRTRLVGTPPPKDFPTSWKFAGDKP